MNNLEKYKKQFTQEFIDKALKELERAKKKYPDDQYPWNRNLNIFEMVGIVNVEAGEALQAANKYYFNDEGTVKNIQNELIQVISTALRVLVEIKINNEIP